jgi:hypothetical protein
MMDEQATAERAWFRPADAAILAIVVVLAAVALAQSWNRWLDPIVDAGRDLYIPEQLRQGVKLYRDIVYLFPPLTPYLLAGVTAVVGSSLASYTAIGIMVAALSAVLLYTFGRVVGSRAVGGAAAALFAACSIATPWSRGGNYLFPYTQSATLGMLFFLGFGCCLAAYLFVERRPALIAGALLFALAASWTKIEFAVFTGALLLVFAVIHRIAVRWMIAYAAVFAMVLAFVSYAFRDCPPDRTWFRGNVYSETMVGSRPAARLYSSVTGLQSWPALLAVSVVGAAIFGVIVLLLRFANGPARRPLLAVAALLAIAFGASQVFFRAWSVLELVALVVALRRPREPLLFIAALAICSSSRIPLNVAPQWYGFVFCVPVYLLMAYFVLEWLPSRGVYSSIASAVWFLAFAAAALQWLASAHIAYSSRTYPIFTPRGVLYDDNRDRAAILTAAGEALRQRGITAVAFFPEGLGLNYLTTIPTPLAYHTFTPSETAGGLEAKVLADLQKKNPEWLAVVARDVREYGYRGFGIDYDLMLAGAIRARYHVERKWSAPRFEYLLLRRNGGVAGATMPPSIPRE